MDLSLEDKASVIWQANHRQGVFYKVDKEGNVIDETDRSSTVSPTHWDTSHLSKFLEVTKEKLAVRYTGPANHENDIGFIIANCPVPLQKDYYYFEVHIHSIGRVLRPQESHTFVSIGFADRRFKMGKHVGEEARSYGYANNGLKMVCQSPEERSQRDTYGVAFGSGDVIGAGIDLNHRTIFFTKNARYLETAFSDVQNSTWTPCIGLHGAQAGVSVNFGQSAFRFPIAELASIAEIKSGHRLGSDAVKPADVRKCVLDYLEFYGYYKTLRLMQDSTEAEGFNRKGSVMGKRASYYEHCSGVDKPLREIINTCTPLEAYWQWKRKHTVGNSINQNWESLLYLSLAALLYLIRQERNVEAVSFAKAETTLNFDRDVTATVTPAVWEMLQSCMTLLAHNDFENSRLRSLLTRQQLANLMDAACSSLHRAALYSSPTYSSDRLTAQSILEHALSHLKVLHLELSTSNLDMGGAFHLEPHIPDDVTTSGQDLLQLDPELNDTEMYDHDAAAPWPDVPPGLGGRQDGNGYARTTS